MAEITVTFGKHSIQGTSFRISALNSKLTLQTICAYPVTIDNHEVRAVRYAIEALDLYLSSTGDVGYWPFNNVICILTKGDSITITEIPQPSSFTCGRAMTIALYNANNWFLLNLSTEQMAAVFLEELFHICYCITDELEVKKKVHKVLQYMSPTLDFDNLYSISNGKVNFT